MRVDEIAAKEHMKHNPTPKYNARGYQNWKRHPAKALLEVDIANKLHEKMKPKHLRKTRDAYKTISLPIFVKRPLQTNAVEDGVRDQESGVETDPELPDQPQQYRHEH